MAGEANASVHLLRKIRWRFDLNGYVVPLTLEIHERDDGSFVATGREIPILIVAKDLGRLKEKLRGIQASVDDFLAAMTEPERKAYLIERGVAPEPAL